MLYIVITINLSNIEVSKARIIKPYYPVEDNILKVKVTILTSSRILHNRIFSFQSIQIFVLYNFETIANKYVWEKAEDAWVLFYASYSLLGYKSIYGSLTDNHSTHSFQHVNIITFTFIVIVKNIYKSVIVWINIKLFKSLSKTFKTNFVLEWVVLFYLIQLSTRSIIIQPCLTVSSKESFALTKFRLIKLFT